MDFRLMRRTIFLAVSAVLLIVLAVAALNWKTLRRKIPGAAAEQTAETAAGGEQSAEAGSNGAEPGADLSAFMQDELFFDAAPSSFAAVLEGREQEKRALSMIATSVEKDLRIQIVDSSGSPVSGQSFYVNLLAAGSAPKEQMEASSEKPEGQGIVDENINKGPGSQQTEDGIRYKDLDQDGVIYIGGLKAGDYMVSLQPVNGYEINDVSMRVSVKDKVEYRIIDDISLLVKTEDEIDASIEDTGVNGAGEDVDGTENNQIKKTDGKTRFGIDVSKWNKEIDWKKVKEAGVSFAVIRCGYRGSSSGVLVEDPYFVKNMRGAIANGISVGVYFFTQAVNEVEAVEEASMVLSLCSEYGLDYPVFIDTEGAGGGGRADQLDQAARTAVCEAFCKTIQSADQDAGVYASRNWLNRNLEQEKLSQYITWLAEYRDKPKFEGKYQLWQYSSNGKIDGIDGRVDLNISYLGY